jgi:hypothetical protein
VRLQIGPRIDHGDTVIIPHEISLRSPLSEWRRIVRKHSPHQRVERHDAIRPGFTHGRLTS